MISVIIPHGHNHEMLMLTLEHFNRQILRDFEIIVIDDADKNHSQGYISQKYPNFKPNYTLRWGYNTGAKGPAGARNSGARAAQTDRLLFIGDDCIPDRNLLWQHVTDGGNHAVQGYTIFHPQVMDSTFMRWLSRSGITANWAALKDTEGKWRRDARGFLLTTNWSISKKDFFAYDGFDEKFPNAAWEDIELGHRLNRAGYPTVFNYQALNFHYHKHTIDTFLNRQLTEGKSRLILCTIHPELAHQLLSPTALREARNIALEEAAHEARQLLFCDSMLIEDKRNEVLASLMQLASFKGALLGIERQPVMKALEHVHHEETPAYICAAQKSIDEDNYGFAVHCYNWLIEKQSDNWACYAVAGEVELAFGNTTKANKYFEKSAEISAGDPWPLERYYGTTTVSD